MIDTHKIFCKQTLVDLGSISLCISQKFIKENNLDMVQLPFLITYLSQTSFGYISTNSSTILTVLMATESP